MRLEVLDQHAADPVGHVLEPVHDLFQMIVDLGPDDEAHGVAGPVRQVVDLFGPQRCLWASNYPVEKLMCRALDQIRNLETVLDDLSEDEKDMIFRRTAAGIYRIALADRTTPADGSWQVVAE